MPSRTPQYLTIFECDIKGAVCEYPCKILIGPHQDDKDFIAPQRCPYNPYSKYNKGISWSKRKLEV